MGIKISIKNILTIPNTHTYTHARARMYTHTHSHTHIYIYIIMKIIPTWPEASLPRFYQTAFQDCCGLI